jgi:hypothetical protein
MKAFAGVSIFTGIIGAIFRIVLVLAAAGALTHYVSLPEPLGTFVWIGASAYAALCVLGIVMLALAATQVKNLDVSGARRIGTHPAPPRRRTRR